MNALITQSALRFSFYVMDYQTVLTDQMKDFSAVCCTQHLHKLHPSFHVHTKDAASCKKSGCSFGCSLTHSGPQCYCKPGYRLASDGTSCEGLSTPAVNGATYIIELCRYQWVCHSEHLSAVMREYRRQLRVPLCWRVLCRHGNWHLHGRRYELMSVYYILIFMSSVRGTTAFFHLLNFSETHEMFPLKF